MAKVINPKTIRQRAAEAAGKVGGGDVGFAEVQALLVNGGFYRAKLSTFLTEFDIIAGGLAWGVLNSRYTIDVQFVENASIKDKIRVAEHICHSLRNDMQCPHDLKPHQIQGLDFPNLAIVIEWLLRRVAAAQEYNAYFARQYTKFDFHRRFSTLAPCDFSVRSSGGIRQNKEKRSQVAKALLRDPPHSRQLRRLWGNQCCLGVAGGASHGAPRRTMIGDAQSAMENVPTTTFGGVKVTERELRRRQMMAHANAVLLEYGENYVVGATKDNKAAAQEAQTSDDANDKKDAKKEQEEQEREAAMLAKLLSTMASHEEKTNVSGTGLGNVMANADQRKFNKIRAQYEAQKEELRQQLEAEAEERNQVERRKEKLESLKEELTTAQSKAAKNEKQVAKANKAVAETKGEIQAAEEALEAEKAALIAQEAELRESQGDAAVDEVLGLGDEVQNIKRLMKMAAEERQRALEEIMNEGEEIASRIEIEGEITEADTAAAAAEADKIRNKLKLVQEEEERLAMQELDLQRDLDDYPTPAEVDQYRLRTAELDEEIAWKYEETKLVYSRHNTTVEVRQILKSELEVLQVINTLFENALADQKNKKTAKSSRESFTTQVSDILQQLMSSRDEQNQTLTKERTAVIKDNEVCQNIIVQQKRFDEMLSNLKDAMKKHKKLKSELKARGLKLSKAKPPADDEI